MVWLVVLVTLSPAFLILSFIIGREYQKAKSNDPKLEFGEFVPLGLAGVVLGTLTGALLWLSVLSERFTISNEEFALRLAATSGLVLGVAVECVVRPNAGLKQLRNAPVLVSMLFLAVWVVSAYGITLDQRAETFLACVTVVAVLYQMVRNHAKRKKSTREDEATET